MVYKPVWRREGSEMLRSWLLALAVLVATVAAFPGAVAAPAIDSGGTGNETGNATNVTPGESVAGALAVQESEVESDLDSRALVVRLSVAANTSAPNASRGELLAAELRGTEFRLAALEDRKATLRAARAEGNISDKAFRVRVARLAAEARALNARIERLETAAARLPNETREEYGLTDAAFGRLATASANLTDAETESLFRAFVGNYSLAADYPGDPNDALDEYNDTDVQLSVEIDRASSEVSFYREQYRDVEAQVEDSDSEEAREALECALEHLDAAEEAVRKARDAADRGDLEAARSHLQTARNELEAAAECLERAREELSESYRTPTGSRNVEGEGR